MKIYREATPSELNDLDGSPARPEHSLAVAVIDPLTGKEYQIIETTLLEASKHPNWEFVSRLGNMRELGLRVAESLAHYRITEGKSFFYRKISSPFTDTERASRMVISHIKSIYPSSEVAIEFVGANSMHLKVNFSDQ